MKSLIPNIIHGLVIYSISILPLWSGGWGPVELGLAIRAMIYLAIGIVAAIAINEYLVHISDIDWEHTDGRWKIVLPVTAMFVGVNLFGDDDQGKQVAMAVGSGLQVLTALRTQSNSDVLMRLGMLAGLCVAAWGMAGVAFWLGVPVLLLLALQFAYEPAESRTYLTPKDHGRFVGAVLALGMVVLVALLLIGFLLHAVGVVLNPPATEVVDRLAPVDYERNNRISWLHLIMLGAALYFGIPYLVNMLSDKGDGGELIDMDKVSSQPRKIAEQFKRLLGRQSPRERIIYSYHEMLKALIREGFTHDIAHTPRTIARVLHDTRGVDQQLCHAVNRSFYRACYAEVEITPDEAHEVETKTGQIVEAYRLT